MVGTVEGNPPRGQGTRYYSRKELPGVAIRLSEDLESRLTTLAEATVRTKANDAREAFIRSMADLKDIHLADSRLVALRTGRSQAVRLEDLERDLSLDRRFPCDRHAGTVQV